MQISFCRFMYLCARAGILLNNNKITHIRSDQLVVSLDNKLLKQKKKNQEVMSPTEKGEKYRHGKEVERGREGRRQCFTQRQTKKKKKKKCLEMSENASFRIGSFPWFFIYDELVACPALR
eukprot:TRINITY_DN8099_c0_g3_i1.p1 TRINITY_DN8099_c0_g3~~TRINITY_DN8099_c0_g3_i1.p1  ORF type:complete len:121 (-),score=5.99 TRINITY_DN8099_c0_g3_i1:45-407(-)